MNIKKHLQNKLKEAYIKCGYNFEPQVVFSAFVPVMPTGNSSMTCCTAI
jgi:hypothetical protein